MQIRGTELIYLTYDTGTNPLFFKEIESQSDGREELNTRNKASGIKLFIMRSFVSNSQLHPATWAGQITSAVTILSHLLHLQLWISMLKHCAAMEWEHISFNHLDSFEGPRKQSVVLYLHCKFTMASQVTGIMKEGAWVAFKLIIQWLTKSILETLPHTN